MGNRMTGSQNPETAAREALELAEDVLSRYPFSSQMWPNGMHPNTGIKQIRAGLAALRPTASHGEVTVTEAMVEAGRQAFQARYWKGNRNGDWSAAFSAALTAALSARTDAEAWRRLKPGPPAYADHVMWLSDGVDVQLCRWTRLCGWIAHFSSGFGAQKPSFEPEWCMSFKAPSAPGIALPALRPRDQRDT